MKKLSMTWGLLLSLFLITSSSIQAATCHSYIEQLGNGDLKLSVTYAQSQYYVEVFVRRNDIQTIAQNIVSTAVQNSNGSFTYSYTYPAANFVTGSKVVARFYSYRQGQPGVFTPGPAEQVWSADFFYNQTCQTPEAIFVSVSGSDANNGTKTSPVKTIAKGIALAVSKSVKEVRVSQGTYVEGNIPVANGVSLLGGYSTNFSARDITLTNYVTTIDAQQPNGHMVCGSKRILYIDQVYLPTIIEGFVMTGGRVCGYGGGIYLSNANQLLIIRNNKITGNSSVGNGTSRGGNIYLINSSAQLYNNTITLGFSGSSFGHDLYLESSQPSANTRIYNNTFTTDFDVYGFEKSTHFDNKYLTQYLVHVSGANGNDVNNGTSEAPVKTIAKGIDLAKTIHAIQVRVAAGTYVEGNLEVANGVSIYGGYGQDFFNFDPYNNLTTIDAQQPGGVFVCGSKRIFHAENIDLFTAISGFTLKGGRLCGYGGGIYINNSSDKLSINNNKFIGNSSVGNGTSAGGNIYVANSAAQIQANEIINGFAGASYGNDIYIVGNYNGQKAEIAYNTITAPSTVYGASEGNVHDNTYLNAARQGAENLYLPLEVKLVDDVLILQTDDEQVAVEVLDITGKTQLKASLKEVSLAGLATGIYIVKAESNHNMVTEKVFVK